MSSQSYLINRHFSKWDYTTVTELERLAITLPILSDDDAIAFFAKAKHLAQKMDQQVVKRTSGNIFDSLGGFALSADRPEVKVECLINSSHVTHGILSVESFDEIVGFLFCVARISNNEFYTFGFVGDPAKKSVSTLWK